MLWRFYIIPCKEDIMQDESRCFYMNTNTDLNKIVGVFVVKSCIHGTELNAVSSRNKLNGNIRCTYTLR